MAKDWVDFEDIDGGKVAVRLSSIAGYHELEADTTSMILHGSAVPLLVAHSFPEVFAKIWSAENENK